MITNKPTTIYCMVFDSGLYIGKTVNLRQRLYHHTIPSNILGTTCKAYKETSDFNVIILHSDVMEPIASALEWYYIKATYDFNINKQDYFPYREENGINTREALDYLNLTVQLKEKK